MSERIGWGFLGPGTIAGKFVGDLKKLDDARRVAVGSRSLEKAKDFAAKHGFERCYGSYEDLMSDPDVDVVYVATPHPFHKDQTIACLEHGKAVLCEKPLGVNDHEVQEMTAAARSNGVFLMEGMWTRFQPVIGRVRQWLGDGAIGEVRILTADLGFRAPWNPQGRLLNRDLAGGALLDVGVYVVALSYMVFGGSPRSIRVAAHVGETGVDEQTGMLFDYPGGALALLSCSVRTSTPQMARIDGTDGRITIPVFWRSTSARLEVPSREPVEVSADAGFHYEAAEVMRCLRAGQTESSLMPLDESLAIARTMREVRQEIGVSYPMEALPVNKGGS